MTKSDLHSFLKKYQLGVLGSICDAMTPQSALVGFAVTRDLHIVFDTVKSTRKYPNLIARPRCSFVIRGKARGRFSMKGSRKNYMGRI